MNGPSDITAKRRFWSAADLKLLSELYSSLPTKIVAGRLGRSLASVYNTAKKLDLKKSDEYIQRHCRIQKGSQIGRMARFKKGHVPANKGLRRPGWHRGRMRETQFQKGVRTGAAARNWKPIGTILPDSDGYLRIKVREAVHGKEPFGFGNSRVWPQYSRHLWEQHHGPVPEGHIVVFKDGDRAHCVIENLELISRAELARRNQMWTRLPRELAEAIQLNGVLKRKIRSSYGKEQNQRST